MSPALRRILAIAWLLFACSLSLSVADEGMWQPHQLSDIAERLSATGLELDPSGLSSLTDYPMGAVVSLGGCSASFVSPEGLVITNHHCVYGSLQYNSSDERDLLADGFTAAQHSAELPAAPGTRIYVTVDVRDVSQRIHRATRNIEDSVQRYEAIERRTKKLVARCEKDEGYYCEVADFHGGLNYYLVKYLEIRDVRLVHAPASSIGRFGGDVDNWMWPRHTGDYSLYRAYVGRDGKPADHADDNVPYRPEHHLRLAPDGVREGDYAMVIGYPGRTNRYRLASEVESQFEWYYPRRIDMIEGHLALIEALAREKDGVERKYASAVAGLNNARKNSRGMLAGYAKTDLVAYKRTQEAGLRAWIAQTPDREQRYGSALQDLEAVVARERATRDRDLLLRFMGRSSMLSTARRLVRLSKEREEPDAERESGYQERDMTRFRQRLERIDRRYDPDVDRAVWRYYLDAYVELPADRRVAALDAFLKLDDPEGLGDRLSAMYDGTKLGDLDTRLAMMGWDAARFESSEDPFVRMAVALYDSDMRRERERKALTGELRKLRPRYMQATIGYLEDRGEAVYADANGTLRVTYGKVRGYTPKDGVYYTPFTTLEGILEKDTGEDPFDSPSPLLQAARGRRHGSFVLDAVDSVPVNFLTDTDTTGGNSGSPTLNGRGELVGLLFDGTWESINADWDFNDADNRAIHVDVRYILWVMDEVYGADALLREMGYTGAGTLTEGHGAALGPGAPATAP